MGLGFRVSGFQGFRASAIISGFRKKKGRGCEVFVLKVSGGFVWEASCCEGFLESCLNVSVVDTVDGILARGRRGNRTLNNHEQPHERVV